MKGYNEKNQLICWEGSGGKTTFTYSRQGSILLEEGPDGIREFAYNSKNQQVKVKCGKGQTQENRYDAEGLRYEMKENEGLLRFVYHKGQMLYEGGMEEKSYHLGYGAEAVRSGGRDLYYHRDEQLSTALLTGVAGGVQNDYRYDAFGVLLEKCEKEGNRILYTGQQYDTATEQYYLRARYYNPQLGRFLQEDPYLGDGLNLYIYCRNNSVVYYDPSGYATTEEILSYFNSQNNSSAIRSSNNSWNSFSQAVGGQGYSSSEIQEAYHVMMGSKNGHYLNRSYLHQSTKDAIDSIRVSGLPNIGYQEAKNRGYQVDIGHKNGYEYWRTRNAAENLGWSQAQYNDYMNSNPKEFYQFEEHYLNISHVDECHDSDVSKLQEAMERYQREQEGSGRWKKGGDNDYEMKERNC